MTGRGAVGRAHCCATATTTSAVGGAQGAGDETGARGVAHRLAEECLGGEEELAGDPHGAGLDVGLLRVDLDAARRVVGDVWLRRHTKAPARPLSQLQEQRPQQQRLRTAQGHQDGGAAAARPWLMGRGASQS
jgi:hypothetical protein